MIGIVEPGLEIEVMSIIPMRLVTNPDRYEGVGCDIKYGHTYRKNLQLVDISDSYNEC